MKYPEASALQAISPIDGRYRQQTRELENYFSEFALIRYRLLVEIRYLKALIMQGVIHDNGRETGFIEQLDAICEGFDIEGACEVKRIERETRHDVKAVEVYLMRRLELAGFVEFAEYVHIGLTSQDVNNTAIPLSLKHFSQEMLYPLLDSAIRAPLYRAACDWLDIPMLGRTHGQPASPTRLGKELMVFVERLDNQLVLLKQIPMSAKFGGATGNFNALHAAYPEQDWLAFADLFVQRDLGLQRQRFTTQIEHYDNLAAFLQGVMRINTILIDLCRDLWTYISMDYFQQMVVGKEVGSSAMPHKVNPIDLENAEGNLGIANALLGYLAGKLPVSRLQRDLTDYTSLRNLGTGFAHGILAYKNIQIGLSRLAPNRAVIQNDLDLHWQVLSEGVQTLLRRHGVMDAYDKVKQVFRTGHAFDEASFRAEIEKLQIPEHVKQQLATWSPSRYLGIVEPTPCPVC